MLLYYNPKNNTLTVSHNNNSAEYFCITVEDIIHCVKMYCRSFLEDKEITIDSFENNNIALRSGHNFIIQNKTEINFIDKLIKTEDKVNFNNETLIVYCAKDYQEELAIDSLFNNENKYLMEDYLIKDNEMEM